MDGGEWILLRGIIFIIIFLTSFDYFSTTTTTEEHITTDMTLRTKIIGRAFSCKTNDFERR